eukprot:GILK01009017.1.p1 GENE.GILK01009017.1~~GILK01009017.1.p1  ORF type:complete len:1302 (+),score=297.70 GILK01009017.1:62-3967(+)
METTLRPVPPNVVKKKRSVFSFLSRRSGSSKEPVANPPALTEKDDPQQVSRYLSEPVLRLPTIPTAVHPSTDVITPASQPAPAARPSSAKLPAKLTVSQEEIVTAMQKQLLAKDDEIKTLKATLEETQTTLVQTTASQTSLRGQLQRKEEEEAEKQKLLEAARAQAMALQEMFDGKTREYLSAQEQLKSQAFSPLFFTSTKLRDEFWSVLNVYTTRLQTYQKELNDSAAERIVGQQKYEEAELEISSLQKQLADRNRTIDAFKAEALDRERFSSELSLQNLDFQDLSTQNTIANNQIRSLTRQLESSQKAVQEISAHLAKIMEDSESDKRKLRQSVSQLELQIEQMRLKHAQATLDTELKVAVTLPPLDVSQLRIRLKTTSVVSEKFAALLDRIYELVKTEPTGTLRTELLQQDYGLVLKGLSSKNEKSISSTIRLLVELGHVCEKRSMFLKSNGLVSVITVAKSTADVELQRGALRLLAKLSISSKEVCFVIMERGTLPTIVAILREHCGQHESESTSLHEAISIIRNLAVQDIGKAAIHNAGGLGPLITALSVSNCATRTAVLEALAALASIESVRSEIVVLRALPVIIQNLSHSNVGLRNASVYCIANLILDSRVRHELIEAQLFQPFVATLLSPQADSEPFNEPLERDRDGSNMISNPVELQISAATVLVNILAEPGMPDQLMLVNPLGAVVKGLQSEHKDLESVCLRALSFLIAVFPRYHQQFYQVIEPLIDVLSTAATFLDSDVMSEILKILQSFCVDEFARTVLQQSGLIPFLIRSLIEETLDPLVKQLALESLLLLLGTQAARQEMAEHRILLPIISLLPHEDNELRHVAFDALRFLSSYVDFDHIVKESSEVLGFVAKFLMDEDAQIVIDVLEILANFCRDAVLKEIARLAGVIADIAFVLRSAIEKGDYGTQTAALFALSTIATTVPVRLEVLAHATAVTDIIYCAGASDSTVAMEACNCIAQLCIEAAFIPFFKVPELIEPLIRLHFVTDDELGKAADIAMGNLCQDDELRVLFESRLVAGQLTGQYIPQPIATKLSMVLSPQQRTALLNQLQMRAGVIPTANSRAPSGRATPKAGSQVNLLRNLPQLAKTPLSKSRGPSRNMSVANLNATPIENKPNAANGSGHQNQTLVRNANQLSIQPDKHNSHQPSNTQAPQTSSMTPKAVENRSVSSTIPLAPSSKLIGSPLGSAGIVGAGVAASRPSSAQIRNLQTFLSSAAVSQQNQQLPQRPPTQLSVQSVPGSGTHTPTGHHPPHSSLLSPSALHTNGSIQLPNQLGIDHPGRVQQTGLIR